MKKVKRVLADLFVIVLLFATMPLCVAAGASDDIQTSNDGAESFVYTDMDSGASFTVPANWKQEELSKDRDHIDAKFVSTKEDVCDIIYGSTDMWEQMSVSDKMYFDNRSNLNNSAFTKADIAAMLDTTADDISIVTYNGVQYFKMETKQDVDVYEIPLSVTMTNLLFFDNGWMYTFQFSGSSNHTLYSDFEKLLESVCYSTVSDIANTSIASTTSTIAENAGNADMTYDNSYEVWGTLIAIAVLAIIATVIIIDVIVLPRKRRKHNEPQGEFASQTSIDTELFMTCENCGQKLPLDSAFCHKCGTKIIKENMSK